MYERGVCSRPGRPRPLPHRLRTPPLTPSHTPCASGRVCRPQPASRLLRQAGLHRRLPQSVQRVDAHGACARLCECLVALDRIACLRACMHAACSTRSTSGATMAWAPESTLLALSKGGMSGRHAQGAGPSIPCRTKPRLPLLTLTLTLTRTCCFARRASDAKHTGGHPEQSHRHRATRRARMSRPSPRGGPTPRSTG